MEASDDGDGDDVRSTKRIKATEEDDDVGDDIFRRLPVDIRGYILSLLPTPDAVTMMLFVKTFQTVWWDTLVFDYCKFHGVCGHHHHPADDEACYDLGKDEGFWFLVVRVLALYDRRSHRRGRTNLHRFHLTFPLHIIYENPELEMGGEEDLDDDFFGGLGLLNRQKVMVEEIGRCVSFAVERNVEVLELNMEGCCCACVPEAHYIVSDGVLECGSIRELNLACCQLNPEGKVSLPSLRRLSLRRNKLSDDMVDEILRGCPLLEDLRLSMCSGFQRLRLMNPRIKRLTLLQDHDNTRTLQIWGHFLVSLDISGCMLGLDLVDVASVEDVSISLGCSLRDACKHNHNVCLGKVRNAKFLTLCTRTILEMANWESKKLPGPVFICKAATLKLNMTGKLHPGLSIFLANCPCLEILSLIIQSAAYKKSKGMSMQNVSRELEAENYWNSKDASSFDCLAHHLKVVNVFGFWRDRNVFKLMEFLKGAVFLEKVVTSTQLP